MHWRSIMRNLNLLGPWIRRFLLEHLVGERNLARNTQASYRDTLSLLLPFVAQKAHQMIDRLLVEDLSANQVRLFLLHLEIDRGCSVGTRNQRLSAIHALARFIALHSPEHVAWCGQICSIPFKKTAKPVLPYLDKLEMDALLGAPDRLTPQGYRDYALLLFLYNTGSRASEAASITVDDINLRDPGSVRIVGKGSKVRYCPLWSTTVGIMASLTADRLPTERVFLNRRKQPITRFGIHALVKRNVAQAAARIPSLRAKQVSPHTIRHTTAVHLLRAGVDINTVRAWLGHVSLDTTHIYAEVDLEVKSKALACCEIAESTPVAKDWRKVPGVMAFLKTL